MFLAICTALGEVTMRRTMNLTCLVHYLLWLNLRAGHIHLALSNMYYLYSNQLYNLFLWLIAHLYQWNQSQIAVARSIAKLRVMGTRCWWSMRCTQSCETHNTHHSRQTLFITLQCNNSVITVQSPQAIIRHGWYGFHPILRLITCDISGTE